MNEQKEIALVNTICNVRHGAMDEKQFRATVEYCMGEVELDARKDEREKVLGEVEREIAETLKGLDSLPWDDQCEDIAKDIVNSLKSLSGNNK